MSSAKRSLLPLMTSRVVGKLYTKNGDPRKFSTHQEVLENFRINCCTRWSKGTHSWVPSDDACPEGTHDECFFLMKVMWAHTAKAWKKRDPKKTPLLIAPMVASGDDARAIRDMDPFQPFIVQSHVMPARGKGRSGLIHHIFEFKMVSEEQVRSVMTSMAFTALRTAVSEMEKTPAKDVKLHNSFVEEIRARRKALTRGEVRQEEPTTRDS